MAKDGLSIRLEGGVLLDKVLAKMAITKQSNASKIVNSSLTKGAAGVRKKVKKATPKNTGQLKKSVKSGLRRKVDIGQSNFLAGVWFQQGSEFTGADGYYARWVLKRHEKNAFNYKGGDDFLSPAIKASISGFRKTVGTQLALKIAQQKQKEINTAL
ncbi:MAG: HK97 gp10 family phage protein [Proteobacteria bacterium]|nr:HK97 gp10 family phage protein [Pseudomonadota bacterium]